VPNVDSVLVVLQRTGPPPPPALRALVQGAFAHRRKALAKSLQLHTGDQALRDRAREALAELGLPEDARAERLTPAQFRALGERIAA
jgi:16S rRNA (adenine1518-N6/adenine1519-N6)-dimethyltransferase